jgi:PmbA protein
MFQAEKTTDLLDRAAQLVEQAGRAGADRCDAVVVRGRSTSVSVRLGKVESTEASESDNFALRVFVGNRVASISANAGIDAAELAERAVAMARVSPEDPYACLADPQDLARSYDDLDLFDPTEVGSDALTAAALAMEEAALGVDGVTNSGGAGASSGMGGLVLVTSEGFSGAYAGTRFGRSVSVIAGEGTAMERDYEYDSRLFYRDLDDPAQIGRSAGQRAVRRLNPTKADTGSGVTIVLDPRVARGFVGHLGGAINGAAVARKTSFLRDMMGKRVMREGMRLTDDPQIVRGPASKPFDGEGVRGSHLDMIEDGILRNWFLSTGTARELGLKTNVSPASTNLALEPGDASPEQLISSLTSGFYVTEVIGQGVNMITGEYSRGASGFWIRDGEIADPVSEVTIASNLKDMFLNATPADDIDRKYATASPTLVIEGMTLAGK